MKNLNIQISDKIVQLRDQYHSQDSRPINLPELKRPDDEAIRLYVESHRDTLSLTDFADWIIKNLKK